MGVGVVASQLSSMPLGIPLNRPCWVLLAKSHQGARSQRPVGRYSQWRIDESWGLPPTPIWWPFGIGDWGCPCLPQPPVCVGPLKGPVICRHVAPGLPEGPGPHRSIALSSLQADEYIIGCNEKNRPCMNLPCSQVRSGTSVSMSTARFAGTFDTLCPLFAV